MREFGIREQLSDLNKELSTMREAVLREKLSYLKEELST